MKRWSWLPAGLVGATCLLMGCGALLDADDLVFDLGAAGGGGSGGDTGGTGGAAVVVGVGGGGGQSSGPGGGAPITPLLSIDGDEQAGIITVATEGRFEIDFKQETAWQIDSWRDISVSRSDLASSLPGMAGQQTEALYNGFIYNYQNTWYHVDDALGAAIVIEDERPARVVIRTTIENAPAQSNLITSVDYFIYPSGRIATHVQTTNIGMGDVTLVDSESHYTSVDPNTDWQTITSMTSRAVALRGPQPCMDSCSNLLLFNHTNDATVNQDTPTNVYWDTEAMTLSTNAPFIRDGEIQLSPSGLSDPQLLDRGSDVINPATLGLTNGAAVGYNLQEGSYVIDLQGDVALQFWLNGSENRYNSVFVINNFPSPDWTLTYGSREILHSNNAVTEYGAAYYDLNLQRLVIALSGVIDGALPQLERTFELVPGTP